MLSYHLGLKNIKICAETLREKFWLCVHASGSRAFCTTRVWKAYHWINGKYFKDCFLKHKCYSCWTLVNEHMPFQKGRCKVSVLPACVQVQHSVLEWNDVVYKFVVRRLLFALSTLSNIKYLWCSSWSNPVEKCHLRTC